MSTVLTVGGLGIGLAVAGVNLWKWGKAGRKPKDLAPFGGGFVLGGLSTLCGGLLGTLAGWTAGANNTAGKGTGVQPGAVAHAPAGQLTAGGGLATFLIAIGVFAVWRAASKEMRHKIGGGWWSGATLTLSVGMAGLFVHVVDAVNNGGDSVLAWFNTGGGL